MMRIAPVNSGEKRNFMNLLDVLVQNEDNTNKRSAAGQNM
jgi:hypothetical protein